LSTERLIHLVSQLLVLAKNQMEAAYIVNFEEIDLVNFVKKITLDFESLADNKDIELSYLGLNEKIMVNGDAARLYDLIYNLIDNAIRYTPSTGKVVTAVTIEDEHACLSVQDNGVGILESDHENVFKRFYRGNESLEFGTGLGLAIVKEIANLHDASINIQSYTASEAKNNVMPGTKITVTFPL
jgi:two-component system sensor histidine kinase TctE